MSAESLWYATLVKPGWAPPEWLFGPVWTVLYVIIMVTFGFVAWQCFKRRMPWHVFLPFGLNLVFNVAFSPIQFGLQNNALAAVDILLVLGTIVWFMRAIWPYAPWVVLANLPYLAWVMFATILQFTITWLNWP